MPDGTRLTPFLFPDVSNGATLLWSMAALMHQGGANQRFQGWDGNRTRIVSGEPELPPDWPGIHGVIKYLWIYQSGIFPLQSYSMRLGFDGLNELEPQQVLRAIAHYWLVVRIPIGVQLVAYQYRLGSAQYGLVPLQRRHNGGLQFMDARQTRGSAPAFTWNNVDFRLFIPFQSPSPEITMALYEGEPGYEPLFAPAATRRFVMGTPAAPRRIFPAGRDISGVVNHNSRRQGSFRIESLMDAFVGLVGGLRGTEEFQINFPRSLLKGITSVRVQHDVRVDKVYSEDGLQLTRYVHPGHRMEIRLGFRFKKEADFLEFGGRINPIGEGATVRLALSEVPGLLPLGGSNSEPLRTTGHHEAGATQITIQEDAYPENIGALPGRSGFRGTAEISGRALGILRINRETGEVSLNSAYGITQYPVGTPVRITDANGKIFDLTLTRQYERSHARIFISGNIDETIAPGQIIQAENGRKLHEIVDVDVPRNRITISPGLIQPLPSGSVIRTGEAVLYYMQPQGKLGHSKDFASGVITAEYAFREVV